MKTATKWTLGLAALAAFLQTAALCSRKQSGSPKDGQTAEAQDDGEDAVDGQAFPTPAPLPAPTPAPAPAPAPSPAAYVDPEDLLPAPDFSALPAFVYPTACDVSADAWPKTLTATGCFADVAKRTFVAGAFNYVVRAPFYSGASDKERAIFLPDGGKIGFEPDKSWKMPAGTRVVKTFVRDGKAIETRILRLRQSQVSGFYLEGASYKWNDAGTDAALLTAPSRENGWYFPSTQQCNDCHTPAAGLFLGLETRQMHTAHQVEKLQHLGLFNAELPPLKTLARHVKPFDDAAPLTARARAYLHVNCASCHQPDSTGNADIDLRTTATFADTRMCDADDRQGNLGVPDAVILKPGQPAKSVLVLRMTAPTQDALMPPFGAHIAPAHDEAGVDLLERWIESLAGCGA